MSAESTFRAKAPVLMARLMQEFPWSVEDAAAVAGNLGHESGGFAILQEIKPVVKGSKGGYGWAQWTGPRRVAFEKFCAGMKLLPSSDAGNTAFLIHELKTTERAAIEKTKAAKTLADKVVAFEKAYERAGVKHYPSRLKWAQIALDAYQARPPVAPPKPESPSPGAEPAPAPSRKPSIQQVMAWLIGAAVAAIAAYIGLR
jgi:hypothetical protein